MKDMGSLAGNVGPSSGTIEHWPGLVAKEAGLIWPTAGAPFPNLVLPLKGAATFFVVFKPISNATFQNFYAGTAISGLTLYWDHTGPRYQVGTTANSANNAGYAAGWRILFCFHYNTGGNPQARIIENDIQLYNGAAGTVGVPIPGTAGVPVNATLNMFKAGASFPFASQIAEWGFYAVDKFATIGPLRAYLRQKYATF